MTDRYALTGVAETPEDFRRELADEPRLMSDLRDPSRYTAHVWSLMCAWYHGVDSQAMARALGVNRTSIRAVLESEGRRGPRSRL